MKKLSIYSFKNYKRFMESAIEENWLGLRGVKTSLARACQCQPAYVSRVLADQADFNLEQTEFMARFFGLDRKETHYLLLLVQENRAGTTELKGYFREQLEKAKKDSREISSSLKSTEIKEVAKQQYYSDWVFSVVHVALSIEKYAQPQRLATALGLPLERIVTVLHFLEKNGLATKSLDRYKINFELIHLDKKSPLSKQHLNNFRLKSMQEISKAGAQSSNDYNYSAAFSVSEKGLEQIRSLLLETTKQALKIVEDSSSEKVAMLNLDLLKLD